MNATYSTGNYWRYGRKIMAGVLAAAVTTVIFAAPAHAGYVTKTCGDSIRWVKPYAIYEPVYTPGPRGVIVGKEWTHFTYHLGYTAGVGDQNNVNIKIYTPDGKIYEYESPDNRTNDRWYVVMLDPSVFTFNFEHNHIGFGAIFDYSGVPDVSIFCRIDPV